LAILSRVGSSIKEKLAVKYSRDVALVRMLDKAKEVWPRSVKMCGRKTWWHCRLGSRYWDIILIVVKDIGSRCVCMVARIDDLEGGSTVVHNEANIHVKVVEIGDVVCRLGIWRVGSCVDTGYGGTGCEEKCALAYPQYAIIRCIRSDILHSPAEVRPVHGQERLSPPEAGSGLLVRTDQWEQSRGKGDSVRDIVIHNSEDYVYMSSFGRDAEGHISAQRRSPFRSSDL
jgi:hypothetical protein